MLLRSRSSTRDGKLFSSKDEPDYPGFSRDDMATPHDGFTRKLMHRQTDCFSGFYYNRIAERTKSSLIKRILHRFASLHLRPPPPRCLCQGWEEGGSFSAAGIARCIPFSGADARPDSDHHAAVLFNCHAASIELFDKEPFDELLNVEPPLSSFQEPVQCTELRFNILNVMFCAEK